MEIKETLKEFGLTEKEAEVYLKLLELGFATASEIAEKTQIHRINIYDILERLQEKGLVSFALAGKRKQYEVINPKKILELEEERKQKIEKIIPELIKKRELGKLPQEAVILKDKKGIKNILEEITKSKTEVLLFASGWGFEENFPNYSPIWHERFKVNKTKIRCLLSSKFKGSEIPKPLNYRFLPSEFVFPSTTCVYEDKVLIVMWGASPLAVLVRGKEISDSNREFFEMLWKIAIK
jgi:sugar-specific transcriptional regulator TrmB